MQWTTPVLHTHIFWGIGRVFLMLLLFFWVYLKFAKGKIYKLVLAFTLIGFFPGYFASFRVPNVGPLIEPHWFIFSSIGFFILVAYVLQKILDRARLIGLVLIFIVILAWSTASFAYNQVWTDQKTYALFWSKQVPHFKLSYFYLADAYQEEGFFKGAKIYYKLSLMGDPSDSEIYNNLGVMDTRDGNLKGAELNFKKALNLNPFISGVYNNLGYVYFLQGQWQKSKEYFSRSLILNPLLIQSRTNLARVLLKDSEYQKAIDLCHANLDIDNEDTETLFLLIQIYIHQEDYTATKKYSIRLINSNNDPKILTKLGGILGLNGFTDVALKSFIKAIHEAPDYEDAYFNAGILLANSGKYDEAIHIWTLGSSIDPSDQRFRTNIAKAITLKSK